MDTRCVVADGKCVLVAWTLVMVDFGHVSDHVQVCRQPMTVNWFSPVFKYCQAYRAFGRDQEKKSEKQCMSFQTNNQHKDTSLCYSSSLMQYTIIF